MTFSDIFTKDFLNQAGGGPTISETAIVLSLSIILGMFIFFVYKRTYQGVMYSKTFNVSLVALSMVSATIILAVTSNIILSLGMVGALSIVRFRTAIKDPIDIVYMFWAISVGIISGAGLWLLGIVSSLLLGMVLYAFSKLHVKNEPYLLIVNYNLPEAEALVMEILKANGGAYKIKSKIKTPADFELTVEIKLKPEKTRIVNMMDEVEGVTGVAMVSYNGEFAA